MESKKIRVLLVDDEEGDAFLTHQALTQAANSHYEVEFAQSLTEAEEKLRTFDCELVLLDLGLPESTGVETLRKFRLACKVDLPIIVLSGLSDERATMQALEEGAQDYLIKGEVNADSLSRSIRHSLQRHQLWRELEESNGLLLEKNERLSQLYETAQQFVDNVSHEFRTPLTVIREFTSIIRDGLDGPITAKQGEHLDKVLHRADDLALMVDDMLDISKLEAGLLSVCRRSVHVQELFDNVSSILTGRAESKSINFEFNSAPDLPTLFCDAEKAGRVIINLAINALKFTPSGGSVRVWAKPGNENSEVTIGISDTGPGISPENMTAIFERFQQVESSIRTSTKGFGLGLNIAKELVSLNLGQMNVKSTLGEGSTFTFTLPRYDAMVLCDRYVNQISGDVDTTTSVSIILASIPSSTEEASVEMFDEFLQRATRGRDLVIKANDQTWAFLTKCPLQEIENLIHRIENEWKDYVRNCPSTKLSTIRLKSTGNWCLPKDSRDLRLAFEAIMSGPTSESEDITRGKVLVVDDDPELNCCLGVRLAAAGYEVLSAADGVEGLQAIAEHCPDAVVLDVRMPRMSGMELLHEMRSNETTRNLPVVMLSASVRDQHQALEAGANFFVPKPYQASAVLTAIETSMSQGR